MVIQPISCLAHRFWEIHTFGITARSILTFDIFEH